MAKNGAGQIYWPSLSINTIGNMKAGQGYQMYLLSGGTLNYPANASTSPPSVITTSKVGVTAGLAKTEGEAQLKGHYAVNWTETGSNAIVVVEGSGVSDGDEVAVSAGEGMVVGGGVVEKGRAVVAIWGDDPMTEKVKEGAGEEEGLVLKVWRKQGQKEEGLEITGMTDGLTGKKEERGLKYRSDGAWIVEVKEARKIPTVFSLEQNYPNPFNPTTTIQYGLPKDVRVRLEVYNVLGQRVMKLVDEDQKAGYYQVVFQGRNLSSGVYFYTISAGEYRTTKKLTLLK
jgi:hypothetical protein